MRERDRNKDCARKKVTKDESEAEKMTRKQDKERKSKTKI